jgi:UDP-3-O-[3-hydroxymyristoyl] N-acetylglucosamine deacetylase
MNTDDGGARQRVLLIDDDESVAGSLYQYLLAQGCDVEVAVDSASAEVLMEARQYDVIVVDPYLTGGVLQDDGALLAMIRSRQPMAALIVFTGYDSSSVTISADRVRASAILSKPQPLPFLSQMIVDAFPASDAFSFRPPPTVKG